MTTPHQPQPHTDGIEKALREAYLAGWKDCYEEPRPFAAARESFCNRYLESKVQSPPSSTQPHTDGWQPIMAPEHYRLVLHNVRVLAPQKLRRKPNWSLAMQMFATGSTYAWKACEYAEIDPDAYTVGEVWRRPSTTQSNDGETDNG